MALRLSLPHTKYVLVAIALVAFLAVLWAMVDRHGPTEAPQPVPALQPATDGADAMLKNFVYTSTDKLGAPRWRLDAETATHYEEKNLIQLEHLKITFFTQDASAYTVTAAQGTVNIQTQDFEVSGNVTGESENGFRFRTESLKYQADVEEARTEDRVFLESPQFDLQGRGMILNVKNQKVSLLHDIKLIGKGE